MDRQPRNEFQALLARSVRKWVNCLPGGPFGQPTEEDAHEADAELEQQLLCLGVTGPGEVVESIEGGNGSIFVGVLTDRDHDTLFTSLRIDLDGNVIEE
jgi:hypothetical protein